MPFSYDQFFEVFRTYNTLVGPGIFVFYLMAGIILYLSLRKKELIVPSALAFLGVLWLWMGLIYHGLLFSKINPLAIIFSFLFIAQGALFFIAVKRSWFLPRASPSRPLLASSISLIFYALVVYPVLGALLGHGYPEGPIFGLPCPTVVFTFGLLMLITGSGKSLFIVYTIPVIWSFIGTFAAINLGVIEDFALLPSALFAIAFELKHRLS